MKTLSQTLILIVSLIVPTGLPASARLEPGAPGGQQQGEGSA